MNQACSPIRTEAGRSKPALTVLGMHRSGTSCLAGSLQQAGLHLGVVHEWNPYNRKGNRENPKVMHLNDAVLAYSGGAWDEPPGQLAWSGAHAAERDAIVAELEQEAAVAWGFKDPRTLLTLPFWQDSGKEFRFIGTFRHPLSVASSLHARGQMPLERGLRLWQHYNSRLLDLHRLSPFPLVCFDAPADEYQRMIARATTALGLFEREALGAVDFFDPGLRQWSADAAMDPIESVCEALYQELRRAMAWDGAGQ